MIGDERDHLSEAAASDDEPGEWDALAPAELVAAHASAVSLRKSDRSARKTDIAAFGLSIVIHVVALVLLVRAGILFVPASVALQGGAASGAVADDLAGDRAVIHAAVAAGVPTVGGTSAPPPIDLFREDPPESLLVPPVLPDLAERFTDAGARTLPIGLGAVDPVPPDATFPHHYPARWRAENARAGGVDGGAAEGSGGAAISSAGADTGDIAAHAGGGRAAAGFSPTGSARNKPPAYPAEARRRKYEGTVWLLVDVMDDGSVGGISVDQTSGYDVLDRAALDAVKRWQFTPAQEDGHPVRSQGRIPIRFVLHG
jgi:TonB family protein